MICFTCKALFSRDDGGKYKEITLPSGKKVYMVEPVLECPNCKKP